MHDWTLRSIEIDWRKGNATIKLLNAASKEVQVEIVGFYVLRIPREESWGPSVSVNEIIGPTVDSSGLINFQLEMQSGDKIEVVARAIRLPPQA